MELRDLKRCLLIMAAILAFNLVLDLLGIRDVKESDYDTACIVAAFGAVLWAIRERAAQ